MKLRSTTGKQRVAGVFIQSMVSRLCVWPDLWDAHVVFKVTPQVCRFEAQCGFRWRVGSL